MLAIVCPGQGSQTPGFLTPWLELDGLRDRLAGWSDALGTDLVAHGTTSDAETIKDTAVAQPLIVAAGLLTADALGASDRAGVLAGHSVGEFTAAALAGVLTEQDAVRLVGVRGRAMAQASALTPTGMSAVLGGDPDEVAAALERHGLTPANANGAGQTVAAGTMGQLAALAADPPTRARVIPLSVAGAFHTHHMAPAVDALRDAAAEVTPADPRTTLLSNRDGAAVGSGSDALERLVSQVSNPVRWDLTMATLLELGVTGLLELAPAGTLTGIAKRAMKGVELVALKTPDDLDAARALVAAHAGS
ncbi:ACP S-malonyltransferase [Lapillicoccus jejuensis]|uniref:[acyl-carrier-protein] S-malonyltransferase n=1 Tax=Lapillicoccus jejuensis TaxID=402171 RepID=A0A542E615_9MICO|nr:ACP S-malonyltransferase [Lapillicoccus jejuensis]TQJ10782.1 [acyl-carrier-protein] S-malonyltransferase [Lapillicoccus jejuensis]